MARQARPITLKSTTVKHLALLVRAVQYLGAAYTIPDEDVERLVEQTLLHGRAPLKAFFHDKALGQNRKAKDYDATSVCFARRWWEEHGK